MEHQTPGTSTYGKSLLSLNSLSGRLLGFIIVITSGIIVFTSFLVWEASQTKAKSNQIENVDYPLINALEDLTIHVDMYVASVRENVFTKDTTDQWHRYVLWTTSIAGHHRFLRDNRSNFSEAQQLKIDTLETNLQKIQEREVQITRWITDNYIKAEQDSFFLAELSSREQTVLLPIVDQLERSQNDFKSVANRLIKEIDEHLRAQISIIKGNATRTTWIGLSVGFSIIIVLMAGGYWLVRKFKNSLTLSIEILQQLKRGEISDYIPPIKDELGAITEAVNALSHNLKNASMFAQSIGEGNVDFEFKPVTDKDLLGNSLVQMRDKLKSINDADKRRSWVTEGLATFAGIMRRTDDYQALSQSIISELVKYTMSNQGGVFILMDEEHDPHLKLTACYAFERRKYLNKRVEVGTGLVGQCFMEGRTIYLREIPQDYLLITSGLGGENPDSILIVPLKVNEVIEGVIELASFKAYEPHEIEFVEKVGEIIASTISSSRINNRTRKLLEESQQQSEEMRAQEEEMRQNMEEMQATQEQLHRQTQELKKTQENLEVERSMFQVLMEYLPDRISFKDSNSRILRANKAKAERFHTSPEEMIGKTDHEFFTREYADKVFREEQELLRSGLPVLNQEEQAAFSEGGFGWTAVSRVPFTNDKGEAIGIFVVARDITQIKMAEASLKDREKVIEKLLDGMPLFRYTVGPDGLLRNIWKARELKELPNMEGLKLVDMLPDVYDLVNQSDLDDTDLVCKGMLTIKGEREIFKHYVFKESVREGTYLGFALRQ